MTTCPSFTESVKCTADVDHIIAWGWTSSTGQGGGYPYTPPTGWKFDSRYSDERGPTGSHGGCGSCIMTLVHLITTEGDSVPTPTPSPTPTPTPSTYLTSGTVIDRITRVCDIGEPGYSAYGQSLRKCTYSGSKDGWHGATQGSLSGLLPICYITESVYSYLTDAEIESVRSRIQGIVPNIYAHKHGVCPSYGKCYQCWDFKAGIESRPLPVPYPCAGVICDDVCIGADIYSQLCVEEGADAGSCVFDELIQVNDPSCPGYVPPSVPPDMDITEMIANSAAQEGTEQKVSIEFNDYGTETIWFSTSIVVDGEEHIGRSDADALALNGGGTYTVFAGSFVMPDHGITGEAVLKGRYEDSDKMFECDRKAFTIKLDVPDPCEGVVCGDECFGDDFHKTVCKEGVCIKGTLIESNYVECGYVPPDDDEPDPGEPDDYIPPVDDDISELETDISSLLGDIKPVHIIIAVLAMIFLGLIS